MPGLPQAGHFSARTARRKPLIKISLRKSELYSLYL
jgi:hypothetical protein